MKIYADCRKAIYLRKNLSDKNRFFEILKWTRIEILKDPLFENPRFEIFLTDLLVFLESLLEQLENSKISPKEAESWLLKKFKDIDEMESKILLTKVGLDGKIIKSL
ncbi:MAG TPA: hypothetical protein VHM20_06385 [Gammaproteobacteria bacterium]|nr:hypothetical protein [Gammaproteobacteria bacterium]